jgi:23S rRNA (cytidine1920-2'-O)/16S rRNA (cytidine1409-2'-O)-methyltransferase
MSGVRLDLFLFQNGYARSRTHAANLVKLGKVTLDGKPAARVSQLVMPGTKVEIAAGDDFASLGGIKLNDALEQFHISCEGKTAIDIGASNGGFTDVLLRRGIAKVFAVDVGACALPPHLQCDPRVVIRDKRNARYLPFEDIGIKADLIVIDVSFISLKLILPAVMQFVKPLTSIVALIKPQFEVGKAALNKEGILLNKSSGERIVKEIQTFCTDLGLSVSGTIKAPHPFAEKNQEYFIHCMALQ